MIKFIRAFLITILGASCALAQSKTSPSGDLVRTLFAAKRFDQAAIAPNGQKVAWVESLTDKGGMPSGKSAIYVGEVKPGALPRRISAASATAFYAEGSVAWSPDSRGLAFISTTDKSGPQLYVADVATGAARKLTKVKGFLSHPGWSPDGKTVAVLFIENADRAAGPLAAETVQTGVIKDTVTEQRLTLVDVTTGKLRQISPADMYVYEFDWSPDGRRFVVTAAHGNGDNNWYIAQIYTLDAGGGPMTSIHRPPLQIANPAWSPDGKSIAFIGGLMSDEGAIGGDIFLIPSTGGEARNLTPEIQASPSWLAWSHDGRKVVFAESIDGGIGLATVDAGSLEIKTLWRTEDHITVDEGASVSLAADGVTAAAIRESFNHPPEVWAGPIGGFQQITARNAGLKPQWGEGRSLHWENEGVHLQGWLLYPREFDPAKKYPMVVQVHGGPSSMANSSWPGPHSFGVALAGAGYFVFMPNPRGSYGAGEAFTRANVKDFGYGDWRDILTGVDQVLKEVPVDEHRLGLTGWSYGGYITMWGVTQSSRFAAAAAGAGLANLQSYYGENQIDQWMIPFFGASVYDDPAVYAKSSPITFIKNVKTPTLVLVGDSDGECPTPQSYEFWHALKKLGVETEFVVYAHEGHRLADPEHLRDRIERVRHWFDSHLK
ncbi:MAG TPA: S9 family peptidase [Candidatus Saccharimonadales bacterium]|jgi:dipeptidyl aminopeptidase/acylaminoacyl peptidase|nr:S9 family peptidase [Candidatus Saccharimonadales bacterium]